MSEEWIETEASNRYSHALHEESVMRILQIMNQEDRRVPEAVAEVLPDIAKIVEHAVHSIEQGGRLLYVGSGSSGRLGVLDAAECPPTFGVDADTVQGVIAGGYRALTEAVPEKEDDRAAGRQDMIDRELSGLDTVIGLSAGGNAPYVLGALQYAREQGAWTASISSNRNAQLFSVSDQAVYLSTGAEVIAGSTRLKSGSAQKQVLNMISTASMVRLGKVYKNQMIDLHPTNGKLKQRAQRMLTSLTSCSNERAEELLLRSGMNIKLSVMMELSGLPLEAAEKALRQEDGNLPQALRRCTTQE